MISRSLSRRAKELSNEKNSRTILSSCRQFSAAAACSALFLLKNMYLRKKTFAEALSDCGDDVLCYVVSSPIHTL